MLLYVYNICIKGYGMSVRKNFNLDEEIAKYLEERAREEAKTQTKLIEELLEKDRRERQRAKKMEALEKLKGSLSGLIGDIDIKEARRVYLAEKHGY
jgi:hypothetical protein